jgi:hypothetical protein
MQGDQPGESRPSQDREVAQDASGEPGAGRAATAPADAGETLSSTASGSHNEDLRCAFASG